MSYKSLCFCVLFFKYWLLCVILLHCHNFIFVWSFRLKSLDVKAKLRNLKVYWSFVINWRKSVSKLQVYVFYWRWLIDIPEYFIDVTSLTFIIVIVSCLVGFFFSFCGRHLSHSFFFSFPQLHTDIFFMPFYFYSSDVLIFVHSKQLRVPLRICLS